MEMLVADMSNHALLRDGTARQHGRLHRTGAFARILRGPVRAADVRQAVLCQATLFRVLDGAAADRFCRAVFRAPADAVFRRGPLIDHAARRCPLPVPPAAPGREAVLAQAYVYLGARKGGVALSRRLTASGFGQAATLLYPEPPDPILWPALLGEVERLPARQFKALLDETTDLFTRICAAAA